MKTLEDHLRERLSDSRAMIGALDINHDRVLLHFGAIGELARITLSIDDNEIKVLVPDDLLIAWQEMDAAKRSRTPLDPAEPLTAILAEDGTVRIGTAGPEVIIEGPDGTRLGLADLSQSDPVAAVYADGKLYLGDGGAEIEVPEAFHANIVYRDGKLYPAAGGAEITLPPAYIDAQKPDPATPIVAIYAEGKLFASDGGPEIELPDAFLQDLAATMSEASGEAAPAGEGDADGGGDGNDDAPKPVAIDPAKHNLEKLTEIAKAEGVEIADGDTKKVIAAKINAKRGIPAA